MSPPTGNDCRRATATKGPSPRKISLASGRRWPHASATDFVRHSGFDASHRPGMTLGSPCATAARAARGGTAMDAKGQLSGHLMLISPERVFYAGLLGRPRKRTSGGYHIYFAVRRNHPITQSKARLVSRFSLHPP